MGMGPDYVDPCGPGKGFGLHFKYRLKFLPSFSVIEQFKS